MPAGEGLWDFANRFYAAPGVSGACLTLQDESGVDVCVLMLMLWLATRRRALRPTQVKMVLRTSAEWRNEVVQPLRVVRRRLKNAPALVQASESESLRNAIKAAELKAERLELNALEALFGESHICEDAADPIAAARRSLRAYADAVGLAFPAAATDALMAGYQEITAHE